MTNYIVLLLLLGTSVVTSQFSYSECKYDLKDYVEVNKVRIHDKIHFPSNVSSDLDIRVLKSIPDDARVTLTIYRIVKVFGEFSIRIPCIAKAGSCDYSLCKLVSKGVTSGDPSLDFCNFWPKGKPCGCPIEPMDVKGDNLSVGFPALPGIAKLLVNGVYTIKANFYLPQEKKSFYCIDIRATLG